jgi:hypothetical protein
VLLTTFLAECRAWEDETRPPHSLPGVAQLAHASGAHELKLNLTHRLLNSNSTQLIGG